MWLWRVQCAFMSLCDSVQFELTWGSAQTGVVGRPTVSFTRGLKHFIIVLRPLVS